MHCAPCLAILYLVASENGSLLAAALIESAIKDLARPNTRDAALAWIRGENAPLTFADCCARLDVSAGVLRTAILRLDRTRDRRPAIVRAFQRGQVMRRDCQPACLISPSA